MQRIFKDERRSNAPFYTNPGETERISPPGASRTPCVDDATRRHPLLPGGKIRSRHGDIVIGNRP